MSIPLPGVLNASNSSRISKVWFIWDVFLISLSWACIFSVMPGHYARGGTDVRLFVDVFSPAWIQAPSSSRIPEWCTLLRNGKSSMQSTPGRPCFWPANLSAARSPAGSLSSLSNTLLGSDRFADDREGYVRRFQAQAMMAKRSKRPASHGHQARLCSTSVGEAATTGFGEVCEGVAVGAGVAGAEVWGGGGSEGGLSPAMDCPWDAKMSVWLSGPNFSGACMETLS